MVIAATRQALISRCDIPRSARRRTRKGKPNEETYYNDDEGRERVVGTSEESEWEHCAPDGLVASPHLDDALPTSIRFRCCFIITGRNSRPHNTRGIADDNCHATDPWQSVPFYGLGQFITARDFFCRSLRESEGAWASFISRRCRKSRSYVLTVNNKVKERTKK